ncbi:uncharacterized protein BHQ10_003356 [Talaromyces amestolkiae]|uniref:BZIP domain-containing protein n=1 Tax=Talaromyces amestolkiae TaxID=1196081 RepID=A0A364KUX2_TALAM|nr:uncharacterized protein BHQ10_003356 [Talaromyces amestolkiae]RAO67344.1 hypothetical protein BHQ10_003356 [Talaromyces amestolkiae]
MNSQNVNQYQQQQGITEPYTTYLNYQHLLPGYGGNVAVQQQQHHHDAQASLRLAVSGAEENQEQLIHRPVYTQQKPLTVAISITEETEARPTQSPQKSQKKRPRTNPKTRPTATQSTDLPTVPIVDRVPSGKERRRTQMRMAQRAYRQRKQNELSSRAKQLSERDDVILRMKKAFDLLQARLMESDMLTICPRLEGPMMEMERGFEALGQMANDSGSAAAPGIESGQVNMPDIETGVVNPNQQRQWMSPDFGSDSSDPFDPLNQPTYPVYGTTAPTQTFDMQQQYPDTYQQYTGRAVPMTTMNEISLPAPAYIPPPTSYSFQETTFARRLMRICVERAHDVLVSGGLSTLSPKEARVFKLAYRIWSRDYLVQKFQMALTGISDLYDPSVPFLPLGGAGTHYMRESPPPISQSMSSSSAMNYDHHNQQHLPAEYLATSGPLTTHTAHIRHNGPDTSLIGIVSSLGLLDDGSEWFDAQDIDGYLQDMGIRLEPHSTTYRFSVPANPGIASRKTVMGQNPLAGIVNQSAGGNMMGQEYVPAYVDIERFINSLVTKAMCLGRAPGFRKRDVEEQFYNSIEVLPS